VRTRQTCPRAAPQLRQCTGRRLRGTRERNSTAGGSHLVLSTSTLKLYMAVSTTWAQRQSQHPSALDFPRECMALRRARDEFTSATVSQNAHEEHSLRAP